MNPTDGVIIAAFKRRGIDLINYSVNFETEQEVAAATGLSWKRVATALERAEISDHAWAIER